MIRCAAEIQQAYYADTAGNYDEMHKQDRDQHGLGLAYMMAMIEFFGIGSVLDVGSGTGFVLLKLKEKMPHIRAVGVDPRRHNELSDTAKAYQRPNWSMATR